VIAGGFEGAIVLLHGWMDGSLASISGGANASTKTTSTDAGEVMAMVCYRLSIALIFQPLGDWGWDQRRFSYDKGSSGVIEYQTSSLRCTKRPHHEYND
jgi:hypothetical protein